MQKKFLKYPITNLEDYSTKEKEKLLDATVFYAPESEGGWEWYWDGLIDFFRRRSCASKKTQQEHSSD